MLKYIKGGKKTTADKLKELSDLKAKRAKILKRRSELIALSEIVDAAIQEIENAAPEQNE